MKWDLVYTVVEKVTFSLDWKKSRTVVKSSDFSWTEVSICLCCPYFFSFIAL